MILADICCQGPQFASLVEELRQLMKRNINTIRQGRFVQEISRRLADCSEQGCFATTMIGTFFSPTRTLSLCNTGNPPPLLYRADQEEWSVFKGTTNTSQSDLSDEISDIQEYQQFETKLKPGDLVLSYSNALTECRDSQGKTIGVNGLVNRVRRLDPHEPGDLIAGLLEQIQNEHDDNLSADDSTLMLCQATKTSVPWLDNVLAPFRMIRGAADKTDID